MTCAAPADARGVVEHHGLAFVPLDPDGSEPFLADDARIGLLGRLRDIEGRRSRAAARAVGGFVDSVRGLAPDLVVVNGEMHEHVIAASSAGVPVALMNSFVSIWRHPGIPPPHHLAAPGVGWKGSRPGAALLWLALRLRKRARRVAQALRRAGCDRVSVLRQLSRERGFDFDGQTDAGHWLIPFTYRRMPVLSLHALEFEFPHRPPAHVHYVGPMVLGSRVDRPVAADAQAAFDAIVARRRSSGERRLIVAAFGSVLSADLAFLRRLVHATSERPQWDMVIGLSDRIPPSALDPLPAGVHVFPWVPQVQLLAHADVMVTHGGINTIDECVLNGVPVLVYCGFETDMGGTTARVVHHGIGIAGDPVRDTAAEIRSRLERLLGEPDFASNVERLRHDYARYARERVAERTIDSLIAAQPRGARS